MYEHAFPVPADKIVAILAEIFRHQRRKEVVEFLENARVRFDQTDYDRWNGGTYTWALRFEVPVPVFASVEPHLAQIHKDISEKLAYFDQQYPNDHLGEVTTEPITEDVLPLNQRMAAPDSEVRRIWREGRFRLFLSHVSEHKIAVSSLKEQLRLCGVDVFVAHEDIEPSREWQNEIELALRSMHALAAILTPDFHSSRWTDHEVGWSLGRGILVVPVRLGVDPYGLMGKFQGVNGRLERPAVLAKAIVKTLFSNPHTHGEMRRALVHAFINASSGEMAEVTSSLLLGMAKEITEEERGAVWEACATNLNIADSVAVRDAVFEALGPPPTPQPSKVHDDIPF